MAGAPQLVSETDDAGGQPLGVMEEQDLGDGSLQVYKVRAERSISLKRLDHLDQYPRVLEHHVVRDPMVGHGQHGPGHTSHTMN